uniref:Kinetochore protein NDC80 homolog n=1 Tax=Hirondellea gigas TaxID=1518452 RepID=A0A2P2I2K5_9CRUS
MQRRSVGGRQRALLAAAAEEGRAASGYTTPNTRTQGGTVNSGGGRSSGGRAGARRSNVPRYSSAASTSKNDAGGSNGKGMGRGRSMESQGGGFRPRLSVTGGGGASNRLSVAVGGGGGSRLTVATGGGGSRLSVAAGPSGTSRTTPVRSNPLNAVSCQPQYSGQRRASCESRASTSVRHKRKDVRPISDLAFKKNCVDKILNFLIESGYCQMDANVLNRKTITCPTTRDFTGIFSFIYGKLVMDYKLPGRFDEEIPKLLLLLQYPVKLPKSAFASVGSPHSWPALLAMLAWLCDIVSDVISMRIEEVCFPSDFDNYNDAWQDLLISAETWNADEEEQQQRLEEYSHNLALNNGVDNDSLQAVEAEMAQMQQELQQLLEEHKSIDQMQASTHTYTTDLQKLEVFNDKLELKNTQLEEEAEQLRLEISGKETEKQQLDEAVQRLMERKAAQNYTTVELFHIKSHVESSAATLHNLQQETKNIQERGWDSEKQHCRIQIKLGENIQRYNNCFAASIVGSIGINSVSDADSTSAPSRGLVSQLEEAELQELYSKIKEHTRTARTQVMVAHNKRSKAEEECRRWVEQSNDRQQQLQHINTRIENMEEDILFKKHENENEEVVLLQTLSTIQGDVSELRRVHRPQIFTKSQHLKTLREQLDISRQNLQERTVMVVQFLTRICSTVDQQLKWEAREAAHFTTAFTAIANTSRNRLQHEQERDAISGGVSAATSSTTITRDNSSANPPTNSGDCSNAITSTASTTNTNAHSISSSARTTNSSNVTTSNINVSAALQDTTVNFNNTSVLRSSNVAIKDKNLKPLVKDCEMDIITYSNGLNAKPSDGVNQQMQKENVH